MLGSTRELIIFNFGQFKIGRHLTVTAVSGEVALLDELSIKDGDGAGTEWRHVKSDETIRRMVEDVHRPSVRGIQPIRAPFFMQKRIESKTVPNYLWSIVESEDDAELARRHPGAVEELRIQNYLVRFYFNSEMDGKSLGNV